MIIVGNNAEVAIRAYLERWSLASYVIVVVGQPAGRPDLMKPDTYTVNEALRLLRTEPNRAVLIGDSASDVEVSRAAGVLCIGYAKTPAEAAGTEALAPDMPVFP